MNDNDFTKDDFQKQVQRINHLQRWVHEFIKEQIAPVFLLGIDSTGQSVVMFPRDIDQRKIVSILRDSADNIEMGLQIKYKKPE